VDSPRVRWSHGMSMIIVHAYSYPRACSVFSIFFCLYCYLLKLCFVYALH